VLAHRPCRVVVEHDPTSGARQPESLTPIEAHPVADIPVGAPGG
jgi:hypothetical protein